VEVQALEAAVPNVVREARLARQDHPETMDNQERAEPQEAQEMPADHQSQLANKLLHLHVTHALLDHQDRPEHQERPAMPVPTEIQDKAAAIRQLDLLDQRDHQDLPGRTEIQEPQETQDRTHKVKTPGKGSQAQPEMPDLQDLQDQQVNQVNPEDQDNQDQRDRTDNLEHQEMTDNPDNLDRQVNPAELEKRVFARNTAPSTEESSSRMELADVKPHSFSKKRTRGDLPTTPCPMNQHFSLLLVAQKTAIYYVSLLYCIRDWSGSFRGRSHSMFFLK